MNMHVAKRISKAISLLLQSSKAQDIYNPISRRFSKFRLNFITLTIPDIQEAKDYPAMYNKVLRPFLQWLTKYKGVYTYVWKAEIQQRGSLHYHITTTTWIHQNDIRIKWNEIILKNDLMKAYTKKYNKTTPPSTDVQNVYKKRNLQSYLSKELCKCVQNNVSIKSKVWDCSRNLKAFKYFTLEVTDLIEKRILQLDDKQIIDLWENEFCTILRLKKGYQQYIMSKDEKLRYSLFLRSIQNFKEPLFD